MYLKDRKRSEKILKKRKKTKKRIRERQRGQGEVLANFKRPKDGLPALQQEMVNMRKASSEKSPNFLPEIRTFLI